MLLDKAHLRAYRSEMTVLVGGLRSLGITANGAGNFSENNDTLNNDFFVNLLDMNVKWSRLEGIAIKAMTIIW